MTNKQKQAERAAIQDRFIAGEITRSECLCLLAAVNERHQVKPTRRAKRNHEKLMAIYAPTERN